MCKYSFKQVWEKMDFELKDEKIDRNSLSTKSRKIELEHRIEMEDIEIENTYKCCMGGSTDKRVLVYISQLSFSLIVLGFCAIQLIRKDDYESTSIYLPLITTILGYWLPSPKLNK